MTEVEVGEWILEVDVEATRRAYAGIATGDPETCGCHFCRNFMVQRDAAYPAAARSLYTQLGIDYEREAETTESGTAPTGPGRLYLGWHHFIGTVRRPAERAVELAPHFEVWFHEARLCADKVFDGKPLVQVEFSTIIPRSLPEDPDAHPEGAIR